MGELLYSGQRFSLASRTDPDNTDVEWEVLLLAPEDYIKLFLSQTLVVIVIKIRASC